MTGNSESSVIEKVERARERPVAARLKVAASVAVAANRWARRTRRAAEAWMDDAAYRVRRDPLRSVAAGVAIGFSLGALFLAWRARRHAGE